MKEQYEMLFFKNVTYKELLDFATEIVKNHSKTKQEDLIQIRKFEERLEKNIENDPWLGIIEGWVIGLASKYDISIKKYIRKKKLEKINKN